MEQYHLTDSEYRFLQVVWAVEAVGSGELVGLCAPMDLPAALGAKVHPRRDLLHAMGAKILRHAGLISSPLSQSSPEGCPGRSSPRGQGPWLGQGPACFPGTNTCRG